MFLKFVNIFVFRNRFSLPFYDAFVAAIYINTYRVSRVVLSVRIVNVLSNRLDKSIRLTGHTFSFALDLSEELHHGRSHDLGNTRKRKIVEGSSSSVVAVIREIS